MKKFGVKMLVVMLSIVLIGSLATISVYAEDKKSASGISKTTAITFDDMSKVTGTWDDSKPRVFDGNKLKITPDVSGNITGIFATDVPAGVYKVGYFLDIEKLENEPEQEEGKQDIRFRVNPYGQYSNNPYFPCTWNDIVFPGLTTRTQNKIIIVIVIKVDAAAQIELLAWPRSGHMTATLDKIVFAGADYDFGPGNHSDYVVFKEATRDEGAGEADQRVPTADEWKPSTLTGGNNNGGDNTGGNNTGGNNTGGNNTGGNNTGGNNTGGNNTGGNNTGGNNTGGNNTGGSNNNNKTGDAGILLAVITASAAAFGGIKLRKKK